MHPCLGFQFGSNSCFCECPWRDSNIELVEERLKKAELARACSASDGGEPHPEPDLGLSLAPAPLVRSRTPSGDFIAQTFHRQVSPQETHSSPKKLASMLRMLESRTNINLDDVSKESMPKEIKPRQRLVRHEAEDLRWVKEALGMIWPKVNVAAEKFLVEEVQPQIVKELPKFLKGFHFKHFNFGHGIPDLHGLEVWEAPCRDQDAKRQGFEIHVSFKLQSDVEIAASVLGLTAGLSYLSLKGSLIIRLDPLLNEEPLIGGIVAYFIDPPVVDFRMMPGIAQVAEMGPLNKVIRDLLQSAIHDQLLLPNVIHVPMVDDEDLVDTASVRDAKPLGVLRVTVSSVHLPAASAGSCLGGPLRPWLDRQMTPEVRLELSAEEWRTPVLDRRSEEIYHFSSEPTRGRVFIRIHGATGLPDNSSNPCYITAQVGQQQQRTTAVPHWFTSGWTDSNELDFPVGEDDHMLRLEVWYPGLAWDQSLGFVEEDLDTTNTGSWHSMTRRLRPNEHGSLQYDVRFEPEGIASARHVARNMHDFFVFDYNQKLQVSVSDVGRWGSPRFLGTTKKRRISELLCWGGVCNGSVQMNLHELPKNTEVSLGAVTLHIEWLEIIPHSVDYDEGLLQFHIDEVFVPEDVKMDQIALSVRVGEEQLRTPLVRLKGGEAAEQDGKTRQSISRTQSIFQEAKGEIETILRMPVSRLALETQSLEIAALNDKGQVVARHAFQLHHLVRAPMRAISFEPCNMHMEDQSDQRISAEVQVRLMGLHRVKHKDAIKRLAIKVTADDASSDTETSQDEGEESVALVDRSFSLQWVNFIYGKLHPKISVIIARMMEDRFGLITQMLQARLPGPLKDIHFKYFRLGDTPPAFGPITVAETLRGHRSAGIEMQVGFQLDTNAHMELSVHGANLGIDRIRVQGQLLVRLGPLLEEVPVLGGIVACFLNPPDLELQYCGVAHCVESTMLANRFQKMVDVGLASALVLPHVFSVPIGTEGQAVDRALLAHPKPIGVLRVTAVRATNLREGWPLKRSRSPYLSLSLAGEEWQTSAVWSSLNPEWDETHDFLVYDKRQTLGIEIVDTNSLFLRKVIGYADPILATDTEAHSEIPLALFDCPESSNTPKAASHPRHPAGNVELRLDWLNFVRHGRKGPDGFCVLRVKFDEVEVPTQLVDLRSTSELDPLRVRMCASIGKVKKSTPEVAWFKRDPTQQDPRTIELDIENVLYMLIHKTDLDSGTLELELLDGHDKVLGSSSLELHKELEATGHAVWNNQRPHRRLPLRHGTGRPCLADVDVSFQGLRSSGDVSQPVGTTPSSPHV